MLDFSRINEIKERRADLSIAKGEDLELENEANEIFKSMAISMTKDILPDVLKHAINTSSSIDIYAEYGDRVSEEKVSEILESEYPEAFFTDYVTKMYSYSLDCEYEQLNETIKNYVLNELQNAGINIDIYDVELSVSELIKEYIKEHVTYNLPEDDLLDREYLVDIQLDTGDSNHDFADNGIFPCPCAVSGSGAISDISSVLWLAKSQGVDKDTLEHVLWDEEFNEKDSFHYPFLVSLYDELANTPTGMPCVTFLVRMTLRELMEINELKKNKDSSHSIHLAKDTTCGLYNSWSGAGGPFEIELVQPIAIPANFIYEVCVDKALFKYSVESTYGMCTSEWKNTYRGIVE